MRERKLEPIKDKIGYADQIANLIAEHFYSLIYAPLLEMLKPGEGHKLNARYAGLIAAVNQDRIHYQDGYFTGAFNASISRELRSLGATWDKTRKAFKLSLEGLPMELKQAVSASGVRADFIKAKAQDALDKLEKDIQANPASLKLGEAITPVIDDLNRQFARTTTKQLEIPLDLAPGDRARLIEEYTASATPPIKEWQIEAIHRLRDQVDKNVQEGFRAEKLARQIEAEVGVSRRKAKFIARQETSLMVSKYRQVRYEAAGVSKYEWSTSQDRRVREDHKKLDGRIFSWDSPPIVDSATGRRAHPGEDFGCRCLALPIITEA
jgi:SPP1 gp7 family putative phage head morphogenesis protein